MNPVQVQENEKEEDKENDEAGPAINPLETEHVFYRACRPPPFSPPSPFSPT
jgi:hypothetical protein